MEYEFEKHADGAIDSLRSVIDHEKKVVKIAHDVHQQVLEWEQIFAHLDELIPPNQTAQHKTADAIIGVLLALQSELETEESLALTILSHPDRTWIASHGNQQAEGALLKSTATHFKTIATAIEKLGVNLLQNLSLPKSDFADPAEYYWLHMHHFAVTYTKIFLALSREAS